MAQNNILSSDYGVDDFCSEITIAGYLYVKLTQKNQLYSKIKNDKDYQVKKSDIYEIYSILRHVRNAKLNGFKIFDELKKEEYYDRDVKSFVSGNKEKIIRRNIHEDYARSVFNLLCGYENDLNKVLNIILDSSTCKDIICKCLLNDCYLYYYVINIKPTFKFNTKDKKLFDFDDDLDKIEESARDILSFLPKDKDYPIILNIWYKEDIITLREKLYNQIKNLLNKFNDVVQSHGKKYYDTFFNIFIENILFGINNKILSCFSKLNHFFCYGSLKYEIINNAGLVDCFNDVYKNFNDRVKQAKFPNINSLDSNSVLKTIFFSNDSLICSRGITYDQYKIVKFLTKEIQRIDFEAIQYEFCRDEILEAYYELPAICDIFEVMSDKYKEGTLLISRDSKLHFFRTNFIKKTNVHSQSFEIKEHPSLKILSQELTVFYDKFYLYTKINNKQTIFLYYNNLFSDIDTAVLVLIFYLFKVSKFDKIR